MRDQLEFTSQQEPSQYRGLKTAARKKILDKGFKRA